MRIQNTKLVGVKSELRQWDASDIMRHYVNQVRVEFPETEPDVSLSENMLFFTINFKSSVSIQEAIRECRDWYRSVMKECFGPNIQRYIKYQPTGFFFVDYEGSRDHKDARGKSFHLHGVMLLRAGRGQDVLKHLKSRIRGSFKDIMIQEVTSKHEHVIGYCMKGYQALKDREEAWTMLPHLRI